MDAIDIIKDWLWIATVLVIPAALWVAKLHASVRRLEAAVPATFREEWAVEKERSRAIGVTCEKFRDDIKELYQRTDRDR